MKSTRLSVEVLSSRGCWKESKLSFRAGPSSGTGDGAARSLVRSVCDRYLLDIGDNNEQLGMEKAYECYDETLDAERNNAVPNENDEEVEGSSYEYESEDPEDTIDLTTEASANHGSTYRLIEFCVTRWFSAWIVMHRFYSLFEALSSLASDIEQDGSLFTGPKRKDFIMAMKKIDSDLVLRALHFLLPIVQGIDYCQRDGALQMDIAPMMGYIQEFYSTHSLYQGVNSLDVILPVPRDSVMRVIQQRMKLFYTIPDGLRGFFGDEFRKSHPGELKKEDREVQEYVRHVCSYICELAFSSEALPSDLTAAIRKNPAKMFEEVIEFLLDDFRYNLHNYMRVSSSYFPLLNGLYEFFYSQPASSASVERSFSMQNSFLVPSRNRMSLRNVKTLLFIKMNYVLAKKNGWEIELMNYLNSSRDDI